jgi:hypothetical protein
MGLLDSAKGAAIRTKLKAEIVLLEREMAVRQKAFGIVMYDLMASMEAKGKIVIHSPFHDTESLVLPSYEAAKVDMSEIQQRKDVKLAELEMLETDRMKEEYKPTDTAGQKAKAAGNWISYAGTETKLSASLALIDRELKIRKEAFGIDVYEAAVAQLAKAEEKTPTVGGIKSALKNTKNLLSKVTGGNSSIPETTVTEMDIRECIEDAKTDIDRIQAKKTRKLQQIAVSA